MLAARKHFLIARLGDAGFYDVASRLSPATLHFALHPSATDWVPFASLVELDKAIHARVAPQDPRVLEWIGAVSAELGIGRVYRQLDEPELLAFLETLARFHHRYQQFGRLTFERTGGGARMTYVDYPCYSRWYCASGAGFFGEAILRHGGQEPDVVETECHAWGDGRCVFELAWRG